MQSTLYSDKPLQLWWICRRWSWRKTLGGEGSKGPKIWDRLRCVTWSFLGSIWTWRALRLSPQWLPRGMVQSVQSKLGVSRWRKWNFPLSMFYLICILRFDIHIRMFSGDSIPLKAAEHVMMILDRFLHVDFMLHLHQALWLGSMSQPFHMQFQCALALNERHRHHPYESWLQNNTRGNRFLIIF